MAEQQEVNEKEWRDGGMEEGRKEGKKEENDGHRCTLLSDFCRLLYPLTGRNHLVKRNVCNKRRGMFQGVVP